MRYFGDKRDKLEEIYPTCTTFCKFHSGYPEGLIERVDVGLIFILAFWSAPAVVNFKATCYVLEDSVPWDSFQFHVIDVDDLVSPGPFHEYHPLGGWGEAFWISHGKIVDFMGKDWSKERFDIVTKNIIQT